MNEPQQPEDPGSPKRDDLPRLYSLNGIGFATFFGSMLAGFFLLAANYHALGMKRPAGFVIGAGVAVFCTYFLIVMATVGPSSMNAGVGPTGTVQFNMTQAILSNVGQVMFLLLITHLLQGGMLKTFQDEMKGVYHSVARSIFVGFLAYLALASLCLILLSLLGLMPDVSPDALAT